MRAIASGCHVCATGEAVNAVETWGPREPFQQPHYLLLNLAIGSNGGDPSDTEFPTRYEIDYVRVYERAE